MTSAAMPAERRDDTVEEGRGWGLIIFAAMLTLLIAFLNMIYAISAIAKSHVFVAGAQYAVGDLRIWGWVTLILSALELVAGCAILMGNQLARWFAVAVIALNAIEQMFFIPAYPIWSLIIIAVDVVALYALCAYGSRANVEASG